MSAKGEKEVKIDRRDGRRKRKRERERERERERCD